MTKQQTVTRTKQNMIKKIFKVIIKLLKVIVLLPILCMLPDVKYDIDKMEKEIDDLTK